MDAGAARDSDALAASGRHPVEMALVRVALVRFQIELRLVFREPGTQYLPRPTCERPHLAAVVVHAVEVREAGALGLEEHGPVVLHPSQRERAEAVNTKASAEDAGASDPRI